MACVVQKYGGSSVADVEKMKKVAARVAATRREGKDVCVVVSAMGDTTDELLGLAKSVSASPPRRELDMLLTAGERISMALLSMALQEQGVPAISFTGSQSGIITTDAHAAARITEVRPFRVLEELARGRVVIVAGFQGVSPRKEVTTLGRGGSDTTAVALAAALGADCEIYSDVAGIFTADPRLVPSARRLETLSYEEMQELAIAGAKVLNAQAVEFAKEKGIAIHARSTFGGAEETVVRAGAAAERIAGVAVLRELAVLAFPAARLDAVLGVLDGHGAAATLVASPGAHGGLVLDLENVHGWAAVRAELAAKVPEVSVSDEGIGALSVVGTGLSASHRVLRQVTGVLAELGVAPRAVFTSALRVTVLADAGVLKDAARGVHEKLVQ
jgi:aspartate kinase